MYRLQNIAHELQTRSIPPSDAMPELRDAIIVRTWLHHLSLSFPQFEKRIFGPSLTSVTGNRICLDGVIRNNPWAYLDYLVYVHIDSYKNIYELVSEKCPSGFTVRDTYNRYNPPRVTESASPLILLLTLTNKSYDVFEMQDFFTPFKTDGRRVPGCRMLSVL